MTDSNLVWYGISGCKRVIASKAYFQHDFPIAHTDSVESVIDLRVPPEKFSHLARFDGSVVVERTAGEVSARCHDEQANFLALNLTRDIIAGAEDGGRGASLLRQGIPGLSPREADAVHGPIANRPADAGDDRPGPADAHGRGSEARRSRRQDLGKFKELIEANGFESGAWRGNVDRNPDGTGR